MLSVFQRVRLGGGLLIALPGAVQGQLRASALASVSQILDGMTITITYSRPRARGRTLERVFGGNGEWGKPWTPGANMATTLDVSRDVTVNGQAVAKGTYSVWMVPRQSGDWTVILDPRFRRYHSEGIDSTAAQIRFPVHTQEGPNTDALTWSILEVGPNAASLTLQWFTTRVTLDLEGQPSRAAMISAEAAAAYVGRYDVTCNKPKEEICHRVVGASGTTPLLLSRENGRLTARYPAQNQSAPFILARNAKDEFVYAWYASSEGDVITEVPEWVTFKFRMASGRATGFEVRNYRNDLVAMATRVAPLSSASAAAQRILCHLRRDAQGEYDGACAQFNTEVAWLTVRPPAASEASVWRGTRTLVGGTPEPVVIDPRSGALAAGRDWLAISAVKQNAASLEFSFDYETPTPSAVDVEILRRARAYLSDDAHWNRTDKNNMAAAPSAGFDCPVTVARSMFCALYLSSLEVAGYYAHFRPAIDAVREAIIAARRRPAPAPLVSFNNDSTTSLTDVQGVLESALKRLQGQPATKGNVESQATQLVVRISVLEFPRADSQSDAGPNAIESAAPHCM
jgi:hypothetical protein